MIRSVNAFFKQGNRPQIANQPINLSPLRYHSNPKTRPLEPKPTVLDPIKRSAVGGGGGVLSHHHVYQQQQHSSAGGNAAIPMKKFIHHAAPRANPAEQLPSKLKDESSMHHRDHPKNKIERTINSINIKLDNL